MASYATYRHVELDRVGVGKKRVLKPPGGGSSIMFGEDENTKPIKSKPQPEQQQAPPQPKEDAPPADKPEKQAPPSPPQQETGDAKPETNGMNSHDSVKEDAAASRDSFPSPAPTTNGQHSPAINGNGLPVVNGSSALNGSMSSGSTSSMSPFPGGTPKHHNTQTRIFGQDQQNVPTPRRRLRDHERSNIFAEDGTTNGTHRPVFRQPRMRRDPVTGVGVLCWDLHAPRCAPSKWKAGSSNSSKGSPCPSSGTPEARTPQQSPPSQQQQQRQRVPPGGFSTRLW